MKAYDIIIKKRNGGELSRQELEFMVMGYVRDLLPPEQIAAFLMAVYFKGMTDREMTAFTDIMARSGEMVSLAGIKGIKVDKHSTGGVGDKTTLVLAPLVASCGVPVAKMSGRGLGHTGGTLDKLESIRGFKVTLDARTFVNNVNKTGIAVIGQTADIAPADKKLYALRDITATVDSIPLIAGSIMSKKLAGGADAIVLDVKTGSGAFMVKLEDSIALAKALVAIGNGAGKKTRAFVTDMNQPLGYKIGNALEVEEALDTLRGKGPSDLVELCLALGSEMLVLGKKAKNSAQGRKKLEEAISSGRAFEKFREFVIAQGGDPKVLDSSPYDLPRAGTILPLKAPRSGYIHRMNCLEFGLVTRDLGAGRARKDDIIDPAVGIVLEKKTGDKVNKGEILLTIHARNKKEAELAAKRLERAYEFSQSKPEPGPLLHALVTEKGVKSLYDR